MPRTISLLFGVHWVVLALAAAAIGSLASDLYRKHLASEAEANLQRIFDAEISYWQNERSQGQFVSATSTPSAAPSAGGYPAAPSAWTRDPGWRALGFTISGPHRYQYRVEAADPGRGFTATAIGDLDGDGVLATFSLRAFDSNGEIQRPVGEVHNQFE